MKVENSDLLVAERRQTGEIGEDVLLIHQTLLGNEAAFEKLVLKYRPAIYALILSYVKNSADAEDLTQEVFIKAYYNLVCLKNLEQFSFWLRQIARNHCKNWFSRRGKMPISFEEIKAVESAQMASPISLGFSTSPEEVALKQEFRAIVWQAIDSLLEIDRKLLEARYLEDASLEQLQEEYGLSYSSITHRLHRAKQKVRETVQKLLGGFCALPGREVMEKIFLGGIEAVKLSLKTKIVTVGTAVVLGLGGGAGVWHWYSKPAQQKTTVVHQQEVKSKKATSASAAPKVVIPKPTPKAAPQAQPAMPPVQIEEKQVEISDEGTEFEQWPAEMKQVEGQTITLGEVKGEEQPPESEEIIRAQQEYLELCAQRRALEDERDALREWARKIWDNLTWEEQEEIMLKQDALIRQQNALIPRLNELRRILKIPPFDK